MIDQRYLWNSDRQKLGPQNAINWSKLTHKEIY